MIGKIYFLNNLEIETFEQKLERMKLDKFIKDYPMFSDIKIIIEAIKNKENISRELIGR